MRFAQTGGRGMGMLALALFSLGAARTARANPRQLPFSYPAETLPADAFEIEQIVDLTPVLTQDGLGTERTFSRATLTTEFEYGITDRLELALYLQLVDDPVVGSDAPLRFDGIKQRLRYRISDPATWPVDVALYGELAELRYELEVEGKIIIQRRQGPWRFVTNLWAEREFYYEGRREWVLHPTVGAAYEFGPHFSLGLEGWLLKEIADGDESAPKGSDGYNAGPLGYLGPTLFAQGKGHAWLALGAYTRLTDFGRDAQVGDHYGRFWFRVMIGIEL
jgi:hypothetical protein